MEGVKKLHIPPYNNQNLPIIDKKNTIAPLVYFNIIKLKTFHIIKSFQMSILGSLTAIIGGAIWGITET